MSLYDPPEEVPSKHQYCNHIAHEEKESSGQNQEGDRNPARPFSIDLLCGIIPLFQVMIPMPKSGPMIRTEEKTDILMVDDHPENLIALQAILQQPNYNLVKAQSGQEALKYVLHQDFAVILLDVLMPDMDGFETAALIKQRERSKDIPIIFLTAISKEETYVFKGYEVGAVDYIFKPFAPHVLKSKVAVFVELFRKNQQLKRQTEWVQFIEKREHERQLSELEQKNKLRYRNLAEAIPHMVWSAGPDGRVDYVNWRWRNHTGLGSEELEGWYLEKVLHPEDLQPCLDRWLVSLRGGRNYEIEGRIRGTDGDYRWHLIQAVPEKNIGGRIVAWLGTATDIHDRKEAEHALRKSEERYRLLVERTKDHAIYMLDPQGCITSWNIGAERIHGYLSEEAVGNPFSIFYSQEDKKQKMPENHLAAAAERGSIENEGWRVRKDGSLFWANMIITRLQDEHGTTVGFSNITRDLTERKEAEEALRKKTEEAQEASRLKSEFVSNVSHELRTPLNAIIGYTSLLLHDTFGTLGGDQKSRLERIEKNAQDLLKLINDLLDLSKIESGKLPIYVTSFDLSNLLEEVAEDMKPLLDEKGLQLRWKGEKPLPLLESDPGKIRQIFTNLLSNAIKFTLKGSVTILTAHSPEREKIEISIQDTGIGIQSSDLTRIFNAFHQVDGNITRQFEGAGLGLTIAKDLVELLKGELIVQSEYGKGSMFTVVLPYRLF